jgi:hypothetical protein
MLTWLVRRLVYRGVLAGTLCVTYAGTLLARALDALSALALCTPVYVLTRRARPIRRSPPTSGPRAAGS